MPGHRVSIRQALGLAEPVARLKEAWIAIRGAEHVPPARYDLTSLRQLKPRLALPLWCGKEVVPRRAILTNLYNHKPTPVEDGWSVRVTQVEDFRGKGLTYDSHNGTDFSIPVGTTVASAAPAEVVRSYTEYNRGGHKLVIDHGGGLLTCYAHLTRPLVELGQIVERAQPIAVSGYSGLDALVTFPFGTPHIHFNTYLDAEVVDPFAHGDQPSLWQGGGLPQPGKRGQGVFERTQFHDDKVSEAIEACLSEQTRERLYAIDSAYLRGCTLVSEWNYYPTRFPVRPKIIAHPRPREDVMSLPLLPRDFDGVVFADEPAPPASAEHMNEL